MAIFHEGGGGGVPSGLAIALHRPRYMLALLITSCLRASVLDPHDKQQGTHDA